VQTGRGIVRTGHLVVDLVSRSVTLGEDRLRLTRMEYRLLHVLAAHLGLAVTHEKLIKEVWGTTSTDNLQFLRVLMRKVRRKIEPDPNKPKLLITESGVGYRLQRYERAAPPA